MYHPSRGGVRGGRDQFKWDDVKVDKHRENYVGHSIMAPVGRWQKGKDLHWYVRDKKSAALEAEAAKEEIRRIKEQEEQLMREALGLAPKRAPRPQGNRLDKHEYAELIKRGSVAEDLGGGHAEAAQVKGLGLYKVPRYKEEAGSSLPESTRAKTPEMDDGPFAEPVTGPAEEAAAKDDHRKKKRKEEEEESKWEKRERKRSSNKDDKRRHHREEKKRKHHSGSD